MFIAALGSSSLAAHDRRAQAAVVAGVGQRGTPPVGPLKHAASRAVPDETFAGSPLLFDSDAVPPVSETSDSASRDGGGLGRVRAASASSADDVLVAPDEETAADARDRLASPSAHAVRPGLLDTTDGGAAGYVERGKPSLPVPAGEPVPPVVIAADANEEELRRRAVVERTTELKERDLQAIEAAVNEISEQQADYADDVHELNTSAEADEESEARATLTAAEASTAEVRQQLLIESATAFAAQANVDGHAAFALLG